MILVLFPLLFFRVFGSGIRVRNLRYEIRDGKKNQDFYADPDPAFH
jgi:hypothetical protein